MVLQHKAYKIRIYPTTERQILIAKTILFTIHLQPLLSEAGGNL